VGNDGVILGEEREDERSRASGEVVEGVEREGAQEEG